MANFMPERIGNYQIIERIGRGGMGDIYKAMQKSLNREIALKVLNPQMGRSDEFSKRFEIEAKAISLLQHNNIVSIYEYGEDDGMKYFAMQLVNGMDLGKRIAQKEKMQLSEIIDYAKQICRGLRYAHGKKVIHRDIKPQNILIDTKNNICRLSDFGIAKIFAEASVTLTGMAVGTPEYMSPEQAEGEPLDQQTDIYSLGIVIYEMLTKRTPFTGNNPISIVYKQVHELPIPPSALRKDTPKRLELIILKALKKNKMDRYRSIEGMLDDLDTVVIDEMIVSPTRPIATFKRESRASATSDDSNRRITDRRNGQRREIMHVGESYPITSLLFWQQVWKTQGISICLILILAILFAIHLIDHL